MKKGFTLIEILITISIVSVMSLLGIKNLVTYLNLYKKFPFGYKFSNQTGIF